MARAMTPRVEQFFFAPANGRSVAALRIGLAGIAAYVFYPYDRGTLATLIQSPWVSQFYRDVIQTQSYWVLAMAALPHLPPAYGRGPRGCSPPCC